MMKPGIVCLLMSFLFAFGGDELDTETLLKGYLNALGGAEAVSSLHSLQRDGTYVFNGLEHPMQIWNKGNKVRFEIEGLTTYGSAVVWGQKEIDVFDGESVWGTSPDEPEVSNKIRANVEVKAAAYLVSSLAWHHLNGKGSIASKGKTTVEGISVYHLVLTLADGGVEDWLLNAETYLPYKMTISGSDMFNPHGWFFDDYRKVANLLFPHYVEIEEGLFTRTYIFTKMTLNPEVDDSRFKLQ